MVFDMVLPTSSIHYDDATLNYTLKERSTLFAAKRSSASVLPAEGESNMHYSSIESSKIKREANRRKQNFIFSLQKAQGSAIKYSTSEYEKQKAYKRRLTQLLSCMYAIFVLTLGTVIYISDLLFPNDIVVEGFGIYLSLGTLVWLMFLHFDIRWHASPGSENRTKGIDELHRKYAVSQNLSGIPTDFKHCIRTGYQYESGKDCGNLYLKIGAAGFCLGTLINEGLELSRELMFISSRSTDCYNYYHLSLRSIHPVTLFLQLFVLFKYSHIIVTRHKILARFGFMHCICSSLCFWFSTIVKETVHTFHEKARDGSLSRHLMPRMLNKSSAFFIGTVNETIHNYFRCLSTTQLTTLITKASPYLYPFSVEFNFLIVTWFVMWQNIDKKEGLCFYGCHAEEVVIRKFQGTSGYNTVTVDCHAANRGLLAGFLVLVFTVVSLIIFFVAESDYAYVELGVMLSHITQTILLILMSATAIGAYHQLIKLDINTREISILDDLLLFTSVPSFFFYGIFSIVAGLAYSSYFSVVVSALNVIQVLIQTPLIVEGLRRVSNAVELQQTRPGRGLVTFLIICNLAIWILDTFGLKITDDHTAKTEFYGDFLWTVFGYMTLPLCLFYRFHSTICLVDIWKCSYEAEFQ